MIKLQRGF